MENIFLSGERFEQMAREYNEKYNSTAILQTKEKEEEKVKELTKEFDEISSLFSNLKKQVKVGAFNFFGLKNANERVYIKLEELEKIVQRLKEKLLK